MPRFPRAWVTIAVVIIAITSAAPAAASPWTMAEDDTLLDVAYDFQFATHEFIPDGTYQKFPLDGRFVANTLRMGLRHGLSDRLELAAQLNFKSVTFLAEPVVLELPAELTRPAVQGSIVDFNNGEFGAGDLFVTGRYNFLKRAIGLANELTVKLPTGYKPPEETFNDDTGDVADDVTLGDAQVDLEDAILFGVVAPTRTFVRLDTGFRFRFGGAGHQVFSALKLGQFVGKQLLFFAGAHGAYSVTQGKVIGQTFVANEFDLTVDEVAEDAARVRPVDLRLDKDFLVVEGGALFVATRGLELQVGYSRVVWGANIAAVNSVTIGTAVQLFGKDGR